MLLASLVFSIVLRAREDGPADTQTVTFQETASDAQLTGTWYRTGSDRGVVLAAGFGSDRMTLTLAATAFARAGFDVFTFDMPGHGTSGGKLGFDNAATAVTANAYGDAVAEFLDLSGISPDRLVLVGHSMGARSALQFASGSEIPFAGLVLLGTSVSLVPSTQAGFFTATDDATLPWVIALGPSKPSMPVALISGTWDDILPPRAAIALYERLSGEDALLFPGSQGADALAPEVWLSPDGRRMLSLHPGTLHVFEPWSSRLLDESVRFATDLTGGSTAGTASPRTAADLSLWLGALVLLLAGSVLALTALRPTPAPVQTAKSPASSPFRAASYLFLRIALWLPALLLAAILCGAALLLPVGLPVLNLVYAASVGGFGLVGLLAGRVFPRWASPLRLPVYDGAPRPRFAPSLGALVFGLTLLGLLLGALLLWSRNGWFFLVPPNARFLWVIVFAAWTVPGFVAGQRETDALRRIGADWPVRFAALLVQYLPFFALLLLFGALGSLSGALGAAFALLALALALAAGRLASFATGNRLVGSILSALVLQALIQVQGALLGF
jgi:pimeloyl-ACP methyl ester carboxylesterase